MIAMLLAGGQGSRLGVLCHVVAIPLLNCRYYILAVVDYIISFIFIKKSFLIGSLPTVGLFVLVECREASIAMQRNSEPSLNVILEIMSNYRCVRFL